MAVPVFYFLFQKMYGGIEHLDAGKFYHDAVVLNDLFYKDPLEYFKAIIGLQDDSDGSFFYKEVGLPTDNWDNGELKDFFYNDNRVVIRIHSLFQFIAFGSYFAQALFNCFFGFVGIFLIYKSLKNFFAGKEMILLLVLCFFPTLWFYTGAVLKESYVLLLLGAVLLTLSKIFESGWSLKRAFILLVTIFFSLLLKPYITFFALFFFGLAFVIQKYYKRKGKIFLFCGMLGVVLVLLNLISVSLKDQSLAEAAFHRKKAFADMANGGIFLCDTTNWDFVRLKYDHQLVTKIQDHPAMYTIHKNVPYQHWEFSHQQDTLVVAANHDTLTRYKLMYEIPKAGSNFDIGNTDPSKANFIKVIFRGIYNCLRHPFFYDAKGVMQWMASIENLLLIISLILVVFGVASTKSENYFLLVLCLYGLSLFALIGFTTPNIGAMLRYRAPAALFILVPALHYLLLITGKIKPKQKLN